MEPSGISIDMGEISHEEIASKVCLEGRHVRRRNIFEIENVVYINNVGEVREKIVRPFTCIRKRRGPTMEPSGISIDMGEIRKRSHLQLL